MLTPFPSGDRTTKSGPSAPGARLPQLPTQCHAAQQMTKYLTTRQCRWQFLLHAFGEGQEAALLSCGQCDNCYSEARRLVGGRE